MKTLLLICISLGFCNLSHAQTVVQKTNNGLVTQIQIGQKATSADVYAAFGKPNEEYSHYDDAAGGFKVVYDYRDFQLATVDGVAYDFGLDSNFYTVRVHNKYVAKVGMPIQTFRNSIPASEVQIEDRGEYVVFWFKIPDLDVFSDEALVLTPDKQGVVRTIEWCVPN